MRIITKKSQKQIEESGKKIVDILIHTNIKGAEFKDTMMELANIAIITLGVNETLKLKDEIFREHDDNNFDPLAHI